MAALVNARGLQTQRHCGYSYLLASAIPLFELSLHSGTPLSFLRKISNTYRSRQKSLMNTHVPIYQLQQVLNHSLRLILSLPSPLSYSYSTLNQTSDILSIRL